MTLACVGGWWDYLFVTGFAVALGLGQQAHRRWSYRRQAASFVLPEGVVARAAAARDRSLTRRAERELLTLGEAIDGIDLHLAAPEARLAWQAALDHYDLARRLVAGHATQPHPTLELLGAVVLAERGHEALVAAVAGLPFAPTPVCFPNPAHGPAERHSEADLDGHRLPMPLCGACLADLAAGRAPETFDVLTADGVQPYFEVDAEPWSSTGIGSLETDLVTALHQRGALR